MAASYNEAQPAKPAAWSTPEPSALTLEWPGARARGALPLRAPLPPRRPAAVHRRLHGAHLRLHARGTAAGARVPRRNARRDRPRLGVPGEPRGGARRARDPLARAVPLLMIFSLVLFLTVEMWEIFSREPRALLLLTGG